MQKLFNVFINPLYLRNTQLCNTTGIDELQFVNIKSDAYNANWFDFNAKHFVAATPAEDAIDAVNKVAALSGFDERILVAELIPTKNIYRVTVRCDRWSYDRKKDTTTGLCPLRSNYTKIGYTFASNPQEAEEKTKTRLLEMAHEKEEHLIFLNVTTQFAVTEETSDGTGFLIID